MNKTKTSIRSRCRYEEGSVILVVGDSKWASPFGKIKPIDFLATFESVFGIVLQP